MELEHMKLESESGAQINLDALYKICPACFTETADAKTGEVRRRVNFETLRQLLGDFAEDDAPETYEFTWPGKQEVRRDLARPIRKTLRPILNESENWDSTQNLYIEGDNFEVLKLLQKIYFDKNKVKVIYIDPPYNTGSDFVYDDDFAMTQAEQDEAAGNIDEYGNKLRKNTDTNGKFHSDWCSMIYGRLMLSRSVLAEDGVIFISIDDNEQKNLKNIADEVFGEHNFLAQVVWERAYSPINLMKHFSPSHDYVLVYAKNIDAAVCNGIARSDEANDRYSNPDNDPRGVWKSGDLSVGPAVQENIYPITTPSGRIVMPPPGRSWRVSKTAFEERVKDNRIWFGADGNSVPSIKRFITELKKSGITPMTIWKYTEVDHSQGATKKLQELFGNHKYFDYPKPVDLIKRCIELYSDSNSIILDFFSGSATTAQAVMELNAADGGNRKFVLVQLPEATDEKSEAYKAGFKTICDIGKERIRLAAKKIKEESPLTTQTLDTGFRVFRVDDSNMKDVYFSPKDYSQDMLGLFFNNVKEDRNDLDLLFGCMLDWGVQLSLPMSKETIDDCDIYTVNEGDLVACFSENITDNVVNTIAEKAPLRVIFRDSSFAQDDAKINIYESFKQLLDWSDDEVYKNIKVI